MACCIAIAFVFGVVRAVWFQIFPSRRPAPPGFAPPAYRSAPGTQAPTARGTAPVAAPVRPDTPRAAMARGVAVGTLSYAVAVLVLVATGLARSATGPWVARDVTLVLIATTALVTALALHSPVPRFRPVVVATVGATWVELGLLDMHLLGLFEFPHHPVLLDLFFHGSGFALLALALPAALPALTRTAPTRSPRKALAR